MVLRNTFVVDSEHWLIFLFVLFFCFAYNGTILRFTFPITYRVLITATDAYRDSYFRLFIDYIRLQRQPYLTLKMTTAQVVETSVTNNSLSKDYLHPDDHDKPITDTPGFKPFTNHTVIHISDYHTLIYKYIIYIYFRLVINEYYNFAAVSG